MSVDTRIILEFKNGKHKEFEPPSGQYVEGGDGVCVDLSSLPSDVVKIHVTMNPYFEFRDIDDDDEDYDEYCARRWGLY